MLHGGQIVLFERILLRWVCDLVDSLLAYGATKDKHGTNNFIFFVE